MEVYTYVYKYIYTLIDGQISRRHTALHGHDATTYCLALENTARTTSS